MHDFPLKFVCFPSKETQVKMGLILSTPIYCKATWNLQLTVIPTGSQPYKKELEVKHPRKASNTMMQSSTNIQQFSQICRTTTLEWSTTMALIGMEGTQAKTSYPVILRRLYLTSLLKEEELMVITLWNKPTRTIKPATIHHNCIKCFNCCAQIFLGSALHLLIFSC